MPILYALLGGLGFVVAYLDPVGPGTVIAFSIGLVMEIAALTVVLRRQDYRERSREYGGQMVELPAAELPVSNG